MNRHRMHQDAPKSPRSCYRNALKWDQRGVGVHPSPVETRRPYRVLRVLAPIDLTDPFSATGAMLSGQQIATELGWNGRRIEIDAWPIGTNPGIIDQYLSTFEAGKRVYQIRSEIGDRRFWCQLAAWITSRERRRCSKLSIVCFCAGRD